MANPFMVTPGNQFAPGLQALAGTVGQVGQVMDQRQQREQQQSYMEEGKAALAQAMQSGDPTKVTEVITQYPELSQAAKDAFGITNERTEAIARDTYTRVLSDPTNAKQYIDAGIQQVAAAGGNPINMVQDYAMFEVDPENALKRIQMAAPMFGIGDKSGIPTAIQNRQDILNRLPVDENGMLKPESEMTAAEKFAAIEAGLISRASLSAEERIAMDEELTRRVAQSGATIKGAAAESQEQATQDVRLAMLPQVEAAVQEEVEKVRRESKAIQDFDKKATDAAGVIDIIEMADGLLDEATESLAGTALDAAGRLVGFSTDGAEAAAKLKTLEGALILKMPRMEGPQSDRDQALYRQMAAQIGDSTVPARIRRAAMETLKELNDKYQERPAGLGGGPEAVGRFKVRVKQ